MRRAGQFVVALAMSALLLCTSHLAYAERPLLSISMSQATYRSGDTVRFWIDLTDGETGVECQADATVHVQIWHLTKPVAHLSAAASGGNSWAFSWSPTSDGQGYGVGAWLEACGERLATTESAFDVADDWTSQPRYGFYSEFGVFDEVAERSAIQKMNRLHINAIQFYDWQYRHEALVPPTEQFVDSLGRPLFKSTVQKKIALAREFGMAPMAYAAIYAASPSFYQRHKQWGLYTGDHEPFDFGDGYLYLMDPSRGSGWDVHMIDQYKETLRHFDFEGIHIDQYGYPRTAYNDAGGRVFLAHAFRTFLDDTKAALSSEFDRNTITFNSVTNWPAAIVSKSEYDFNYVEVWPPYVSYGDIERIIQDAYVDSGGKATVIAAYVDPEEEATVKLLNAVIFAHGGTHIEIGEGDGMLADPYFPLFRRVSDELWQDLIAYYDFLVRYRDWLAAPRAALDATERVWIEDQPVLPRPEAGRVHASLYALQEGGRHTLNLINFSNAVTTHWDAAQPVPDHIQNLKVKVAFDEPPQQVWFASPDQPTIAPVSMPFAINEVDGQYVVELVVPDLHYWSVLVFKKGGD